MAVKKRQKALSSGRPPISKKNLEGGSLSAKATRNIIRTHHRLHKEHAAALKRGDKTLAAHLEDAIEGNGGLKVYQAASKQGQSKSRGGDSSKILVNWLQHNGIIKSNIRVQKDSKEPKKAPYRLLEVGALSSENEISKFPDIIKVTRIDLNSQGPGITQQDFMKRPLPEAPEEFFDIVSLSLVLNYVPDPAQRGEMLKRITQFLRAQEQLQSPSQAHNIFPALFFVLPLPCVANSRYLDENKLVQIMGNLGFTLRERKNTAKLCNYLFTLSGKGNRFKSKKEMIGDSRTMNNFCIVID
ncbi:uncharacterized protein BDR25DRAFT_332451 [Lindgomyces ingoldianus]|uniref:Uncharacterized protein n=1 Tax=Lindgomyces ingoldianus TaxID=673940 RepID=A0ACB6R7V5_9PLEO|nr:uncharacterized protein BDR25DRAFT_332451 [Lindgomyces ingoldianus]KAF2474395.1 hypothetical protein BDR25DRAFT_332451 [Lindgomyces ingoldianus]